MNLEFKNVNFSYDKSFVLKDVSFKVDSGTIVGLIGANGAGKTTTILNIIRNQVPSSGSITMDGVEIHKIPNSRFNVSYIPDTPLFYGELSVYEHLKFVNSLYGNVSDINGLVDSFQLNEHINKRPGELSKGTLQKMMVCMALLRKYELLIADEPFTGLDPTQIHNFKSKLCEIRNQGKAVLVSTHLLDVIEGLCDKYIIIDHGEIIAAGTREQICEQYKLDSKSSIEEIYLNLITARNQYA